MQINIKRLLESRLVYKLIKFSTHLYFGWVLFIALLTLLPGQAIPDINWNFMSIDKLIHFTMFSIMSFLGGVKFNTSLKPNTIVISSILSFLIASSYSFLLEYFQTYIPQRAFDYADLAANVGGAVFGIVFFVYFKSKMKG
jgi:glycopeptide antibiotics resistance protein